MGTIKKIIYGDRYRDDIRSNLPLLRSTLRMYNSTYQNLLESSKANETRYFKFVLASTQTKIKEVEDLIGTIMIIQ